MLQSSCLRSRWACRARVPVCRRAVSTHANQTHPPYNPNIKTALITGGNSGIGFETARALAASGYHTVITARDEDKGRVAVARIKEVVPGASVELRMLRLDSLAAVKHFTAASLDAGHNIDVLVCNAGVMACPKMATEDNFEYQLGVNHLGHFALVAGLLPLMVNPDRSSRIVTVSSAANMFGKIDFDDINSRKNYQPWKAYGQSKLANILFSFELAARLPYEVKCTSNCLHPGVVNTELGRYLADGNPFVPVMMALTKWLAKTPAQGAQTSVYLATNEEVEGITGKYYVDCKPRSTQQDAYNAELRERFWDLSCEMTGVECDVARIAANPVIPSTPVS